MPPEPTKKTSSVLKVIVAIVVLAIIVVAGYVLTKKGGLIKSTAVAIVNGKEITRPEYDSRFAQLSAAVVAQGQSATSTEIQAKIQTQTLENLITETMLLQAAEKEGIKANEGQVTEAFAKNKAGLPDEAAFEKALTAQGLTQVTFKEFLTRDNIIRQYLTAHIDASTATTTPEEVKAFYNQVAANNKTVPPLAEVRTQVANQIVQQKQQQLIANFIQKLRASSTVETLLK